MSESELIHTKTRSLRMVAFGGTAINILRAYRENQPKVTDRLADESYSYIDTSIANLAKVSKSDAYLLPKTDGSGGDRSKNALAFKKAIPDFNQKNPPGDVTIVIFSAAGGSGSAGGPQYVESLLAQSKTVVAIIIGSHNSKKRSANTIGTVAGLEGIVKRTNRPLIIFYRENDLTKTHSVNNLEPLFALQCLSMLVSGKNAHMDSADTDNFFNYSTPTHHAPGLAGLNIYADEAKLKEDTQKVIAFAALMRNEDEIVPEVDNDYDTVGYMPPLKEESNKNYYFTITTERLSETIDGLLKRREELAQHKTITSTVSSLMSDNTQADEETGLVFD